MYSFQGCYSISNDISINNYFTKNIKNNSSIGDCKNEAKINNAPFFALTGGNIYNAKCLIGKNELINENITFLTNSKNKLNINDICNSDISKKSHICGYNNLNKKTDIYAGKNAYSLYTSENTNLLYKNQKLLSKTYESPFYFENNLQELDNNFKNIIKNLKNSYIEYIRSKSESQVFNDNIEEPKNIIIKKENLIQIFTDLINLDNNYNNLINKIINNSNTVFEKLNVFRSSTGILQNEIYNNKDKLDELLNINRADNGQLLDNKLKKNVLILQNIILLISIISILFLKKNK